MQNHQLLENQFAHSPNGESNLHFFAEQKMRDELAPIFIGENV